MNCPILHLVVLAVLLSFNAAAQPKTKQDTLPISGDCASATQLKGAGKHKFLTAPQGHGSKLEISGNSAQSPHYFEREHNTGWFWFDAEATGTLAFKIYPADTAADLDFLLFKYTDEQFCTGVARRQIKPIRSNISRYKSDERAVTGLSPGATEELVRAGPRNHLSKSIDVKKGERYYLCIDNVYGHEMIWSLVFTYYSTTTVSGTVLDETGQPVGGATVAWEAISGELLAETVSEPGTGKFEFEVPVRKGAKAREYVLAAQADKMLFVESRVNASTAEPPKPIEMVLPELKKGSKMVLTNINFYGNKAVPLPRSKPTFKRLHRLMKANKSLVIRIEGHTNGCFTGSDFSQILSEQRAQAISEYLMDRRTDPARMTTIGKSCTEMLYPDAKTMREQELNRRVEVYVVSL